MRSDTQKLINSINAQFSVAYMKLPNVSSCVALELKI